MFDRLYQEGVQRNHQKSFDQNRSQSARKKSVKITEEPSPFLEEQKTLESYPKPLNT